MHVRELAEKDERALVRAQPRKRRWWQAMVRSREDVVGLDSSILMHPMVWKSSGHVSNFSDPMVDCRSCKRRFRCDEISATYEDDGKLPEKVGFPHCPEAKKEGAVGKTCDLTPARKFNLMFETHLGPVVESSAKTFLRPETAQGIFANFANVTSSTRVKVPFGIAQIGKSFRNEINPRNFTFRSREFEQMELEFFCKPGTDDEWFEYWIAERRKWYLGLGMKEAKLRFRAHEKEKLSHYSKGTTDVEYLFPFGWGELEGIANRTDFDLSTHAKHSGADLSYFDQANNERYVPYVIEPAAGLSRSLMTFLVDAYTEDEAPNTKGGVDKRVVLRLDKRLAPVKVAVLPLSRNADLSPKAKDLATELRANWTVDFDDSGAIGRRYRRQDEIGTPYCVTVDFDTLDDHAVTVRERDSMKQERIALDQATAYFAERLLGC